MRAFGFRQMVLMMAMLAGTLRLLPVHTWADEPADLVIELVSLNTEVVAGVETLWQIRLLVPDGQHVKHLRLRPTDPAAWHWPNGELELDVVTASHTFSVSTVPLAVGELYPSVNAVYTMGDGTPRTKVALGDTPVRVVSVSDRITVQNWSGASTVEPNGDWTAEVCVQNDASVSLAEITIRGQGTGLIWRSSPILPQLAPGQMHCQLLSAAVTSLYPAPHVEVRYTWQDAKGTTQRHSERLALNPPQVLQPWSHRWLDKVPENSLSVLFGAVIAIVTGWFSHRWTRRRGLEQEAHEQLVRDQAAAKRVRGLLRVSSAQALQAADGGRSVPLELLKMALTSEGMYAAVERNHLQEQALALWVQAELHNNSLVQGGGMQRAKALRQAARTLQTALDVLEHTPSD